MPDAGIRRADGYMGREAVRWGRLPGRVRCCGRRREERMGGVSVSRVTVTVRCVCAVRSPGSAKHDPGNVLPCGTFRAGGAVCAVRCGREAQDRSVGTDMVTPSKTTRADGNCKMADASRKRQGGERLGRDTKGGRKGGPVPSLPDACWRAGLERVGRMGRRDGAVDGKSRRCGMR